MELGYEDIKYAILNHFEGLEYSGADNMGDLDNVMVGVDNIYTTVTKKEIRAVIQSSPALKVPPDSGFGRELADCDDYALQLKALTLALYRQRLLLGEQVVPPAVGMILSQDHAFNFIVWDNDGSPVVSIVDPSEHSPKFYDQSSSSRRVMGTLPIQLIYL